MSEQVWGEFLSCKLRFPGLHQQSSWLTAFSNKCKQIIMLIQQRMLSVQQAPALYSCDCLIPTAQLKNVQYCWQTVIALWCQYQQLISDAVGD